ncbi:uncharacterized protein LOC129617538 isoform X1 [Condylostylus longicornis]|uniref:uncharacterized protein LOC129617538 isoform X1 n=1 Tax=Condylostylus longicornis TaxID=2530218 RepID=UPI00244E50A1|nr:uncharacterized protein LOC129617538 isoform X1 [Condylostylus longicornis]
MVLAERHAELLRNGRRSRGPSPNGHNGGSPDTSSDEDNSIKRNGKTKAKQSEYEEKIRVGRDYQAVCPELIPVVDRKPELLNDRALLVWSPTKDIPDCKLEEYISVAKEKYGYNGEQALGMLFWHKHDLERAVMDLANFTPFPDEWTVEDKVLFEQAFQFHGKSFHRIRQMLPDKSIASLVKYYYSWKKTRHRQSVMDRQEKAKASKDGSENGSENGSNEESENDDKEQTTTSPATLQDSKATTSGSSNNINVGGNVTSIGNVIYGNNTIETSRNTNNSKKQQLPQSVNNQQGQILNTLSTEQENASSETLNNANIIKEGCCTGCGVSCNILTATLQGKLCNSCHHHWRRTGNKRPTTGPYFKRLRDRSDRQKRKPPRGMHINHDDIVALASSNNNQDELLSNTEREIVSLLSQVQQNKQAISSLKRKISESCEDLRPIEQPNRINSRWSNEELSMAVHGVKKFGKDFQAIAEMLGTKTEAHVRTFFVNYRRRYNLDNVLKEFEAERTTNQTSEEEKPQDAINSDEKMSEKDITESKEEKKDDEILLQKNNIEEIEDKNIALLSNNTVTNEEFSNINDTTIDITVPEKTDITPQINSSENIIMEIDLDSEASESSSPIKKIKASETTPTQIKL